MALTGDADGRPSALGYPSGLEVAYAYGARGLLSTISAGGSALATYAFDANGRRTGKAMANGTGAAWTYDAAGQVLGIEHSAGSVFASREYTYNTVGNRTSMTSLQPGYGPLPDNDTHDAVDQIQTVRYAISNGGWGGLFLPGETA